MHNFDVECKALRVRIEQTLKPEVLALLEHPVFRGVPEITAQRQYAEMKANIMLSFRHLEDARMRLGKAIQAFDGGTSVYDT